MSLTNVMFVAIALQVVGTSMLAAEATELYRLRRHSHRTRAGGAMATNPNSNTFSARRGGRGLWGLYFGFLVLLGPVLADAVPLFHDMTLSDPLMSFRSLAAGPLFVDLVAALPAAVVALVVLSLFGSILIPAGRQPSG